jgi:hypothetical protein
MIRPAVLVTGLVAAVLVSAGCDLPPTDYTVPDGAIGDTGDSDTLVGPEECPHNSGYPCTCDLSVDECADESTCLWVADPQELEDEATAEVGFCSAACFEEGTPCVKTGFSAESLCVLAGGGASFRCALVCEEDDNCPPDQHCKDVGWNDLCHP